MCRSEASYMLLQFCKRTNLYDMMDGGSAVGSGIVLLYVRCDLRYRHDTIRYDTHDKSVTQSFFKSRVLCFHDALWR